MSFLAGSFDGLYSTKSDSKGPKMDVLVFCLLLVESIILQVKQLFYCILAHSGTLVDALGVCFLGRLKNAKEDKGWAQYGCFFLHKMTSNVGTRRRVAF